MAKAKNSLAGAKANLKKSTAKKKVMAQKGPIAGAIKALGKTRDGKNQKITSAR